MYVEKAFSRILNSKLYVIIYSLTEMVNVVLLGLEGMANDEDLTVLNNIFRSLLVLDIIMKLTAIKTKGNKKFTFINFNLLKIF